MLKHFLAKMDNNTQGPLHHFPQKFKTVITPTAQPIISDMIVTIHKSKKSKKNCEESFQIWCSNHCVNTV